MKIGNETICNLSLVTRRDDNTCFCKQSVPPLSFHFINDRLQVCAEGCFRKDNWLRTREGSNGGSISLALQPSSSLSFLLVSNSSHLWSNQLSMSTTKTSSNWWSSKVLRRICSTMVTKAPSTFSFGFNVIIYLTRHPTLRLSGSPTQLTKEARLWRVRPKRLLDGVVYFHTSRW